MSSVKEKFRKAAFAKLTSLQKKLNAQNIPCVYSRSVLSHEDGENAFKIIYQATGENGDATLLPKLSIRTGRIVEEFDHTIFDQGLARLKEQFHVHENHDDV